MDTHHHLSLSSQCPLPQTSQLRLLAALSRALTPQLLPQPLLSLPSVLSFRRSGPPTPRFGSFKKHSSLQGASPHRKPRSTTWSAHCLQKWLPKYETYYSDSLQRTPMTAKLVKRTAASEQRHLQQLISLEELRDCKPTQLLRRMEQLLGDTAAKANQGFLCELFLQRLPPNVRIVLASGGSTLTLKALADTLTHNHTAYMY